jgi:serine/threonine protein kinase
VKGWAELKEAFWAAVDGDPEERARHVEALRSVDPALSARLEALLAADDQGESLQHLFQAEPPHPEVPARIGMYDVVGVLGVGGMGEVYRAWDTRLQREVAIKVLPAAVTNDPERLARFEREAQVLASLNHPHIAQVYGLDESGGMPALVMELVPGPTLADVIAAHPDAPLPLPRTLSVARQIADGLEAAHDKGIVHRDLKPRNIALTQEGDVKILDFGVAKSLRAGAPRTPGASGATEAGVLLGTPAYMSPEQARGLTIDKRSDIWAFGCLLYELLTGRQAFAGTTASDSLVAVLEREPDMAVVPAGTPAAVRSLLRHCLEKDPKRRLRDIGDARLAIDDVLNQAPGERSGLAASDVPSKRAAVDGRAVWLLAGLAIATAAWVVVRELLPGAPSPDQPRRTITSIVLPRGMRLGGADLQAQASESRFAISPDGRRLALIASDESGRTRIWLRDLGSPAFQPLPQTEDASFPFWSPDSGSIGFVAAGRLKAIRSSDSSTPMTVNDAGFRTAAWSLDNRILFAPAPSSPLYVVPESGGVPTPATSIDTSSGEVQHGDPAFLPDGRHFLYFSIGSLADGVLDPRGTYLGSLDTAEPARLLLPGATQARYASGHILYVRNGTLMAQPFDVQSRELRGAPFPLVEDVKLATAGATGPTAAFSVSDDGVLAYQAAVSTESIPVVFDRTGRQLVALAAPADYSEVALSPDGTRLAVSVTDPARSTRDLWLYDVEGGRGQRVTFDPGDEFAPVWSPDGMRLLFSSLSKSLVNLHIKAVMTASDPVLLEVDNLGLGRFAADWSRDGRYVMYIGGGRAIARSDLWVAPLASPNEARALVDSPFVETHGRFAPDGRWFAYTSNETGQLEIYVDRFPDRGAKRLVSTQGGRWPRWARDGTELFYVSPENQLMAIAIKAARDRLETGVPRPLFTIRARPPVRLDAYPYDVSPDGRRFVVNTLTDDTTSTIITVVFNWIAGLPKR